MDTTKIVIVCIIALAALIATFMGIQFINQHWEDIKTMGLVALILGGALTIGGGGVWLKIRG